MRSTSRSMLLHCSDLMKSPCKISSGQRKIGLTTWTTKGLSPQKSYTSSTDTNMFLQSAILSIPHVGCTREPRRTQCVFTSTRPPSTPRLLSMATWLRVGQSAACVTFTPNICRSTNGTMALQMSSKMGMGFWCTTTESSTEKFCNE